MSTAAAKKSANVVALEEYKKVLLKDAEHLVLEEFPIQVLEFNRLLENSRYSYDRLPEILPDLDLNIPDRPLVNGTANSQEDTPAPPSKKRKMATAKECKAPEPVDKEKAAAVPGAPVFPGNVPCNALLEELMEETRPMLREAVESVNKVKMWILFLIPRIEDGNNFGVSIQEETLNEVRTVESEAASFLDQMSRYFVSRAKLITKVAKYPFVTDYRRAIRDMDEKQFINIRLVLTEMRNHFATLHDMITKNLEKIKKPRNSNNEHMY